MRLEILCLEIKLPILKAKKFGIEKRSKTEGSVLDFSEILIESALSQPTVQF